MGEEREGGWEENGYCYKRATREISMAMEMLCITTVLVNTQAYICE